MCSNLLERENGFLPPLASEVYAGTMGGVNGRALTVETATSRAELVPSRPMHPARSTVPRATRSTANDQRLDSSHPALLRRPAPIMGNRRNVADRSDRQARGGK